MRISIFLTFALVACAPLPPTTVTPTEARGLAMLHDLRAMDPCEADTLCKEVRRGD